MKRLLFACLACALVMPAFAFAQSAFNGTWKTDLGTAKGTGKPFVITLKDGVYHCTCSNPPINVKADGEEHPVTGHPGYDMLAVKVVNDHTIESTAKKAGKLVSKVTLTVAADRKTLTNAFTDDSGSSPVTGNVAFERVGGAPHGENGVAGTWKFKDASNISANGITATYKVDGNEVSFSDPTGDSYVAKIDGKAVPYKTASEDNQTVSVKRVGKDALRETWYRDGKETSWDTLTIAANGKTMKTVSHNLLTGRGMTTIADKQ